MSLENILSQEVVQKLGWTLLHFVWQATAAALVLAVVLAALRKSTANLQYIITCLALGLMVLLPIVTMWLVPVSPPQPMARIEPSTAPVTVPVQPTYEMPLARAAESDEPERPESIAIAPTIPWKQRAAERLEVILPYIVSGWLIGVFGLSVWHLGGWAQLQRLRRQLIKPVDATLHARLKQLADKLGVGRAVELLESALVQVPTVVGWLRPVILLPASALTGLTAEQLEALLAHELAHVRRYDYLVNMLQTVIETLGFYHPAVWWVSHRIRGERENCCDDLAIRITGDRVRYARALTSMEEIRSSRGEFAIAASGGNLFARIRRLVGKDSTDNTRAGWIPPVISILLIAIIAVPASIALNTNVRIKDQKGGIESNKVVLKLVDPNSQPVVGARVGTSVDWPDTAENPPIWFLRDGRSPRAVNVESDEHGKVTLKAGDLFWSMPPTEQKAPLTAIDKGYFLTGLRELSREDLGTEVTLTLQPGCRVHGRVSAATARKRELSTNILNVWVYWRVHTPYQYASKQGRFEFVLAPGKYRLRIFSENPNNSVTLPILIKPGQRDLDLTEYLDGTSKLPETESNRQDREGSIESNKVVLKLVDPNSRPVVGAWVGTFVDWSDVAESPPIWFLNDGGSYKESKIESAAKIISNSEGKIILTEEELFKPYWPTEVTVPLTAIDAGHYLAGLRELSREDLGTEVTLTLQPGCRVHGRVSAATARKRKWSTRSLTVYVYWHVHRPCQYSSREGQFEFVLPPGKYEVQVYAEHADKSVTLPILIKPGQRELDLTKYLDGTSKPPAAETGTSAQFILDRMLEHRSRVKNLQYIAVTAGRGETDEFIKQMEDQLKKRREEGASERDIGFSERSLARIKSWRKDHENRYETITCTIDNEGRSRIELTRGDYDASGKKMPADYKLIQAWNGIQSVKFYQNKHSGSLTATIKDVPSGSIHPWRLFISDMCQSLKETVEAKKDVSVERLKDGTYRIAFDDTTQRRIVAVIDPSKGYTCALREDYDDQGKCTSRYTATYEEVAEGIWFPVSGELETFSGGSTNYRRSFTSSDIRINGPTLNATYFDVDMPEGTEVTDEVQGKQCIVGSKRVHDLDKPQKTSTETQEVDPNTWQEKFYSLYRLEEGQVLKRIAPPFIPERREYFKLAQPGRYSANTPYDLAKQFIFSWDGDLNIRNIPMGGGIPRLSATLESVIGLGRNDYDIPPEVLSMDMSGDWIIRKDTPQEELLLALEPILKEETGRDIHFIRQKVESKVIVARGTYRLTPLPDAKEKDCVHVYTDKLDTYSGAGGGSGTLGRFLRFVGDHRINMIIIDRTESGNVELSWRNHYSSDFSWLKNNEQLHSEKEDILLNNLSRQTGLTFKREAATVEKWFISEKGTINAPQKTDAAVDKNQVIQKLFALKHCSPSDAAQMVRPLLGKTGYVSADQKTNTLLIVDTVENLKRIEKIIADLDVPQAAQTITQIFEIRHGNPSEIVESLKKGLSIKTDAGSPTAAMTGPSGQPVVLIPEPRRKWIIAKASAEDMKKVQERIEQLDRRDTTSSGLETKRDDFQVFKPRIIKLENSDPAQMVRLLTALFAEEGGGGVNLRHVILGEDAEQKHNIAGPLSSHFTFEDVPGTSAIVVISNIPGAYEAVEQLVLELDKQKMATKDAKQAREYIAGLSRFAQQVKESEAGLMGIGRAMRAYAKDHDGKYPLAAKLYELREYLNTEEYGQYEYMADGKTTRDPADIVIYYDAQLFEQGKGTNVLFNDGHVEFIGPERLDELNINKTQILIETRILEVTDGFLKENWLDANSVLTGKIRSAYPIAELAAEPNSLPYCLIFDDLDVNLLLKATATPQGKDTKVLAAPQVMALDGRPVMMKMVTKFPVPGPSDPNDASGKAESRLEYAEVGTSIKITPDALPDSNNVLLDFEWQLSQVRGFEQQVGPDGKKLKFPLIACDNIKTTATVPAGKTLLIGGKKIRRWAVTQTKKPLLGDLPLIGFLFRSESKVEETRNVLILVKPTIEPEKQAEVRAASKPKPPPLDPNDPLIRKLERRLERASQ